MCRTARHARLTSGCGPAASLLAGAEPVKGHGDQTVHRGAGSKAARSSKRLNTVRGELLGRHVGSHISGVARFGEDILDESLEFFPRLRDMASAVQQGGEFIAASMVRHERIGRQHCLQRLACTGALASIDQLAQVV